LLNAGRHGEVNEILRELAELVNIPVSAARTMHRAFYTSPAFLDLECEHVFRKEWVCLGHVGEVAQPGDYFVTDLVGESLIVTHGTDSKIRVLSNVCRHRANLVAKGRGNAKQFICGYHAWSYNLDGSLRAAPRMLESKAFAKDRCDLPAFATEIWQDFIYVNLDGEAAPLAQRADPFLPHIKNYHQEGRYHQFVVEEVWQTNWKCLVENFMEGYHLSVAHAKTLHPMTPTSLCRKISAPLGMTAFTSGYNPDFPARGPFHPDLTAEEQRYSVLFSVFPNCLISIVPNVTLYLLVRPIDVDSVAIKWGLAGTIADPSHPDVIRYRDLCFAFNAEDKQQLEGVQKGLKSRYFKSGPLAPPDFEGTIWDFYQYMADKMARLSKELSR
jgi:phenylpropionate dioxygenase-like ring-hydroxylating dioxygenase large terminal subunit